MRHKNDQEMTMSLFRLTWNIGWQASLRARRSGTADPNHQNHWRKRCRVARYQTVRCKCWQQCSWFPALVGCHSCSQPREWTAAQPTAAACYCHWCSRSDCTTWSPGSTAGNHYAAQLSKLHFLNTDKSTNNVTTSITATTGVSFIQKSWYITFMH